MRTLFGKKKDKDSSENFSSVSTPSLPPAAPAEEGCSDLAFLPSRPVGDWPPALADRRRPVDTEDIPLPGRKSKLAGLFDEDVATEAPKSEHLEVKVPAAAPSVPGPSPATMGDAKERKVFLIRGTDLEVGGESISSEWTTDSEAEQALQALQAQKGSRGLEAVPNYESGRSESLQSGWGSYVQVSDDGLLSIRLARMGLDVRAIQKFCAWLPTELQRLKQAKVRTLYVSSEDIVLAYDVDLSQNDLDDEAMRILLLTLKQARVVIGVAKFYQNRLSCRSAILLSQWIRSAPGVLFELHLSHNQIKTAGALELIQAVAETKSYPSARPGSKNWPLPLWLRLEHNDIPEAANFERKAELCVQAARPDTKGKLICWFAPRNRYGCRSDNCGHSTANHCPVFHIPHLRPETRNCKVPVPTTSDNDKVQKAPATHDSDPSVGMSGMKLIAQAVAVPAQPAKRQYLQTLIADARPVAEVLIQRFCGETEKLVPHLALNLQPCSFHASPEELRDRAQLPLAEVQEKLRQFRRLQAAKEAAEAAKSSAASCGWLRLQGLVASGFGVQFGRGRHCTSHPLQVQQQWNLIKGFVEARGIGMGHRKTLRDLFDTLEACTPIRWMVDREVLSPDRRGFPPRPPLLSSDGGDRQRLAERFEPERHRRGELYWFDAPKKYRGFALAPAFLRQDEIEAIAAAAKHSSVKEINDRKGYLAFKHRVWRFELQLRSLYPELYARLMALMRSADEAQWQRLCKSKKVYPEVEYIEYDVDEMGEPCFIEPHVDNKSAVTMVAMLSAPDAYVGGRSCFRRASGSRGHREVTLQKGDIVLFRGEKLVHWITPVTAGRRVILQIELSRV
ncbi:unnamed protein product [Symbiodinium sp. CCMP2456]|nr:unnamed protein product [Symbiodinium sp. CCMP2456]